MADTPFGFTQRVKVGMAPTVEDGKRISRTFMGSPVHECPAQEDDKSFMVGCTLLAMSMEG